MTHHLHTHTPTNADCIRKLVKTRHLLIEMSFMYSKKKLFSKEFIPLQMSEGFNREKSGKIHLKITNTREFGNYRIVDELVY